MDVSIQSLVDVKKTDRPWHFPLLVCLSTGIPLLIGWYVDNLQAGSLASVGGLVILYTPPGSLYDRMVVLLTSALGFVVSYAMGICFSFHPGVAAGVLGLFSSIVHWIVNRLKLQPPRSFFFIMMASMAICLPFDPPTIPGRVGLVGAGTLWACLLGCLYSVFVIKRKRTHFPVSPGQPKSKLHYNEFIDALLVGVFMLTSMLAGHWLQVKNPYWVPISCAAVMQGINYHHVWQRGIQRILGTCLGLGLCWILLTICSEPLHLCLLIMLCQFAVELFIVRHYGLAVIFMTPLTILLTQLSRTFPYAPSELFEARFFDCVVGSLLGGLGGWLIYHEVFRQKADRSIRRLKVNLKRAVK